MDFTKILIHVVKPIHSLLRFYILQNRQNQWLPLEIQNLKLYFKFKLFKIEGICYQHEIRIRIHKENENGYQRNIGRHFLFNCHGG